VQEFHDAVLSAHRAVLERYVRAAADSGVEAICEALWGTPFHEVVLGRVAAARPDLVVKHSVYHNRLERTVFTGSDWHLIRDCPAPLLLVKAPDRLEHTKLLVCVDPMHSHDKPASLDHRLLSTGTFLAGPLHDEVHALHVFSVPVPVSVVGDAYVAAVAAAPAQETLAATRRAFRDLLDALSIPAERGHLEVGAPARDILALARKLDVGLVVMGAVSRGRLDRWFVGNTAEAVLDRLPCNVWVEKPGSA
jgi:universal stress protein E